MQSCAFHPNIHLTTSQTLEVKINDIETSTNGNRLTKQRHYIQYIGTIKMPHTPNFIGTPGCVN